MHSTPKIIGTVPSLGSKTIAGQKAVPTHGHRFFGIRADAWGRPLLFMKRGVSYAVPGLPPPPLRCVYLSPLRPEL